MATSVRRPLVAGNWKMNGLKASAAELGKIVQGAGALAGKVDLMICPPATLIMRFVADSAGSGIEIGGHCQIVREDFGICERFAAGF